MSDPVVSAPTRYLARCSRPWIIFTGYAALAVILTWPLATCLTSCLPLGQEPTDTVPLLNAWTLWWNADRLEHGWAGYWDAPIFYPERATLALGEPQPVSGVLSWPLQKLLGLPAAYNGLLLLHLTLNGLLGVRFLRGEGLSLTASRIGGVWLMGLPLVGTSLGVFQVIPIWGILWTLAAARQAVACRGTRRYAELGAALAVTYGLNCHYGLFLLTLLPPWMVVLAGGPRRWRLWVVPLLASTAFFAVLASPVWSKQWRELGGSSTRRDPLVVRAMSATLARYGRSPHPFQSRAMPVERLGMGWLKYALALGAVVIGWRIDRHLVLPQLCLAGGGFLLSMAVWVGWRDWNLAQLMAEWIPGMHAIRNWFRYAVFFQIAMVVLAAWGVDRLHRWWFSLGDRTPWSIVFLTMTAAFGLIETWPAPQGMEPVPAAPRWARWLGEHHAGSVLAVLPLGQGPMAADHRRSALAMLWQPVHRCRLVNGYNGYFPASQRKVLPALRRLPDESSLRILRRVGTQFLVVYGSADSAVMKRSGWRRIASASEPGVELWQYTGGERATVTARAGASRSTRSPGVFPSEAASLARSGRGLP